MPQSSRAGADASDFEDVDVLVGSQHAGDEATITASFDPGPTAVVSATTTSRVERPIGAPTSLPPAPDAVRWQRRYQVALAVTDFVMALSGAGLAAVARWHSNVPDVAGFEFPLIAVGTALAWVVTLYSGRAYERSALGFGLDEFRRVLNAGVHLLAVLAIAAFLVADDLSRSYLFGSVALVVTCTLAGRYALRRYVHHQRKTGRAMHRVLVVGTAQSVRDLARHFSKSDFAGYAVAGACIPFTSRETVDVDDDEVPVLGQPAHVGAILRDNNVDVVAVADTSVFSGGELRALAWELEEREVELVVAPAIADFAGPRISVNPVAGLPLLHVDQPRMNRGARLVKRTFETAAALLALVLLAPFAAVIALLIKVTSPGPIFFEQERVGLDHRIFRMFKFRTMVQDAEARLKDLVELNEHDGVLFKIQDDPRITRIGKWLRRLSLDELPQLMHVVTGKMALVGPRPPLPCEVEKYDDLVRRRLLVRPGLTGLWQVSGRSDLSWAESVRLDVYYVDNWSLGLDILIVLKTITAVVRGRGAY